jgi:hypothetical protein
MGRCLGGDSGARPGFRVARRQRCPLALPKRGQTHIRTSKASRPKNAYSAPNRVMLKVVAVLNGAMP